MSEKKVEQNYNHLIIDAFECNQSSLADYRLVQKVLEELPSILEMKIISGPHVIDYKDCEEIDQGVTGVVVIAESHLSIHTYPNRRKLHADIFSCKEFSNKEAIGYFLRHFNPVTICVQGIHRPIGSYNVPQSGIERVL